MAVGSIPAVLDLLGEERWALEEVSLDFSCVLSSSGWLRLYGILLALETQSELRVDKNGQSWIIRNSRVQDNGMTWGRWEMDNATRVTGGLEFQVGNWTPGLQTCIGCYCLSLCVLKPWLSGYPCKVGEKKPILAIPQKPHWANASPMSWSMAGRKALRCWCLLESCVPLPVNQAPLLWCWTCRTRSWRFCFSA